MKECAMASQVLNLLADYAEFMPQCATCVVDIWQQCAETDREIIDGLLDNENERHGLRHR